MAQSSPGGGQVALVGFGVGAVADVVGSVDFSTLVLMGTSQTMLVAVLMGVLSVTLRSMVRVGLLTETARRMGIAPDHSDTVRNTVFRMISFFAVVGWTVVLAQGLSPPRPIDCRHSSCAGLERDDR